MDRIQYGAGCGVVRMPKLNPEILNRIFAGVEVFSAQDMNATFLTMRLADMSLTRAIHSSYNCRSRRLRRHMGDGTNAYHYLCMPVSGEVGIEHLGRSCILTAGTMCLVSTDYEYFIEMSDELDAFWLRIPSQLLPGHAASVHEMLCRAFDVSKGIGYAAAELINSSLMAGDRLTQRGNWLISQSLLGFLGELLESSFPSSDASTSTVHRRKIFSRARDYIEENISDELLSPEVIAEGIGISKRYLSQIFSAEGFSVMRWVQRRRLELCKAEIQRDSHRNVAIQEIAYSKGFSNISSFNRSFKMQYGCSPSEVMFQYKEKRGNLEAL